jgi:signal peptidase I
MGVLAARPAGLTPPPVSPRPAVARARRVLRRTVTTSLVVAVLLACAVVTGILPVQVMRVGSDSMTPTLSAGDLVVVSIGDVSRRDVVVVRRPGAGELIVKRAVALGGDVVAIEDGVLVVDGSPVCEPGIDPDRIDGVFFPPLTVPDGELFLLGDDRRDAVDSRDFGTVREEDVAGVVQGRVWPEPGGLVDEQC